MAWVSQGTVAVINGSSAVVGTGTNWFGNMQNGWGFVGPDGRVYEVLIVNSATSLTLRTNYQGATASDQSYGVFPTSSLDSDLAASLQALISSYAGVYNTVGQGRFSGDVVFDGDRDTGLTNPASNEVGLTAGDLLQLALKGGIARGAAVMSSPSDATPGKLMTVPAFGLGGGAPVYNATSDFNDIITGGMYTLSGIYTNGPDGAEGVGYNSTLLVIQREYTAGASRTQILSRTHLKPDLRMRVGTGNPVTWTDWVKIPMPGDDVEFGALTVTGGIDFGQTTLDFYEEGSWTPILTDGSNNATAVSNGTYTRVGDLVTLTGRIPVSSLGSLSGTLRISGFPFVTINSSAAQGTGLIALSSGVNLVSANTMFLFTQQGNTFCYISEQNAGGTSGIQASEFTDTANIQFSLTYRTA